MSKTDVTPAPAFDPEAILSDGKSAVVSGVIGVVGLAGLALTHARHAVHGHDWGVGLWGGVAMIGLMAATMSGIAWLLRTTKRV